MKHFTKQVPSGYDNTLLDNVYAIIDSRIQYLEYENARLFKQYTAISSPVVENSQSAAFAVGSNQLMSNFESLLEQMTRSSHSLKLLLFLRTRLIKENASTMLGLLTDNRFLDYSEDRLQGLLSAQKAHC